MNVQRTRWRSYSLTFARVLGELMVPFILGGILGYSFGWVDGWMGIPFLRWPWFP